MKEMNIDRDCKGWSITKKINAIENLTLAEKCVLQKIDTEKDYCTNLKIALFYRLGEQYISNIIASLIKKEYIKNGGTKNKRKLVIQNLPAVLEYANIDSSWVDRDIALIDCLSLKAKFLLGEISNKSKNNGRYFAGNKYLSKKFGVSTVQISRLIKKLRDKEFITATYKKSLLDRLEKTALRSITITARNRRNIELSQVDNLAEV